jgi:hypothetical protein
MSAVLQLAHSCLIVSRVESALPDLIWCIMLRSVACTDIVDAVLRADKTRLCGDVDDGMRLVNPLHDAGNDLQHDKVRQLSCCCPHHLHMAICKRTCSSAVSSKLSEALYHCARPSMSCWSLQQVNALCN